MSDCFISSNVSLFPVVVSVIDWNVRTESGWIFIRETDYVLFIEGIDMIIIVDMDASDFDVISDKV